MQGIQDTTDLITSAADEFWQAVGGFVPSLLGAVLLIILGVIVAKLAEVVVIRALELAGLNRLKKNKKVAKTLKETGLEVDVVSLSGRLSFWVVIIIFAMTAADVLGLTAMRDVIRELLAYVPNVLAAAIVLTVTLAGAKLIRTAVTTALVHMGVGHAAMVGTVTQWAVVIFGSIMTIDQLGFDTTILATNVTVIVAGVVLALALAFGLGGRDQAQKFLEDLLKKSGK